MDVDYAAPNAKRRTEPSEMQSWRPTARKESPEHAAVPLPPCAARLAWRDAPETPTDASKPCFSAFLRDAPAVCCLREPAT